MRLHFIVSFVGLLFFLLPHGHAYADESSAPLSRFLLTDDQIAQNCAKSISAKDKGTDKTECEMVYENLRAKAQQYQSIQSATASGIANQGQGDCSQDSTQENCLNAGKQVRQNAVAAYQRLAEAALENKASIDQLMSGTSP